MAITYLITGGAGFIGRQLSDELLMQGHRVRIIDSISEQVHGDHEPALSSDVELIRADIRDAAAMAKALDRVDGVFHLAAEVGVGQSMYEISRYVGANDLGTAVLLEQLIRKPVERLVVASSMSVYGEGKYCREDGAPAGPVRRVKNARGWDPTLADGTKLIPIATDESKEPDLASIYALTKYAQERACLMIGEAYGMQAVALRLFNVFGPGQALSNPYTGVLANFGSRLLNGQRPIIFEDGRQKRDFVHVRDVANAFHLAMRSPSATGRIINIGSGQAYAISRVAELLANAMNRSHLHPEMVGKARAGDVRHCFADISTARDVLGYAPTRPLQDSMVEMADWIAGCTAQDRGEKAKRELEALGLVA